MTINDYEDYAREFERETYPSSEYASKFGALAARFERRKWEFSSVAVGLALRANLSLARELCFRASTTRDYAQKCEQTNNRGTRIFGAIGFRRGPRIASRARNTHVRT